MDQTRSRRSLRHQGRTRRRAIGAERARAEAAIVRHLLSLHVIAAREPGAHSARHVVGLTIADDGEPDLASLASALWEQGSGVAVPTLSDDPDDYRMVFRPWQPGDLLTPGRFDIPTPPERPSVEPNVLVVPFVGFDHHGNRIGRGAGFYDRYLAATGVTAVGAGFETQRMHAVPVEPHDVPLDAVVTELGVRFFENRPGDGPRANPDGLSECRPVRGSVRKNDASCE